MCERKKEQTRHTQPSNTHTHTVKNKHAAHSSQCKQTRTRGLDSSHRKGMWPYRDGLIISSFYLLIFPFCPFLLPFSSLCVLSVCCVVLCSFFFSFLRCGDYYRYCSEVLHDKSLRLQFEKKCFEHYSYALKLAHAHLPPNHPYRLGVSLNYSVTLYEILKDRKQAVDLAKNAFDSAIHLLDSLDEQQYKDSTLTMQLLRDNLTLWIAQEEQFQLAQQQQQQGGAAAAAAAAPQAQVQAQAQQQATGRTTVPAK